MRLFILLLLLSPAIGLYAQETPGLKDIVVDTSYTPAYRYRALGLSYKTTKDRALSPLLFQGPGLAFSFSSWKYKNQWLWQSDFRGQFHLLDNAPASARLTESGLSYQLTALRELTGLQKGPWRFWAGPEARMLLNGRMHSRNVNNIASYDWATALGGSAMLSTQFEWWGRTFALSQQFHLPLIFLYARPPYAWGVPPPIYEEQKGAWKEAFQLGTLNDILLLQNQLTIDFYLRKRQKGKLVKYRAYRLAYSWSYFQVVTRNTIQTGGHELTFSRVLTF